MSLAEHCIYTIVHPDRLDDAYRRGEQTSFREARHWVTGLELWQQAHNAGASMPVLLGDAISLEIRYWGLIAGLTVSKSGTRFTVDRVRKLRRSRTPQKLVLRSTGRHIAPNFRRPYAICEIPGFVSEPRRTKRRSKRSKR
jgi:hypothetical protein